MHARWLILAAALGGTAAPLGGQQLEPPSDWRWVTDRPAELVGGDSIPEAGWRFVTMVPGWHVTTGPGAIMYRPGADVEGRFVVESQIFIFPGDSQEEYGIFVGGKNLEQNDRTYLAFVLRRDGSAAVLHRAGRETHLLSPWARHDSIAVASPDVPKNVLRVIGDRARVSFTVNGQEIASLPRADLPVEGTVGFRIGAGMNLHAVTLDVTRRLAETK
ncbi:MAG: hypothetical protein AB7I33_15270 [Gemmatimonadales bacterium]